MKLPVPVNRVVDANVKVRVKADGSGVELANVKMAMNPCQHGSFLWVDIQYPDAVRPLIL